MEWQNNLGTGSSATSSIPTGGRVMEVLPVLAQGLTTDKSLGQDIQNRRAGQATCEPGPITRNAVPKCFMVAHQETPMVYLEFRDKFFKIQLTRCSDQLKEFSRKDGN